MLGGAEHASKTSRVGDWRRGPKGNVCRQLAKVLTGLAQKRRGEEGGRGTAESFSQAALLMREQPAIPPAPFGILCALEFHPRAPGCMLWLLSAPVLVCFTECYLWSCSGVALELLDFVGVLIRVVRLKRAMQRSKVLAALHNTLVFMDQ